MKVNHPCPDCYDERPEELSDFGILADNPNLAGILRCRSCGFIYRMGKDGRSLDYPTKNIDHKRLSKLSKNDYLRRVFEFVERNEGINIAELAKKLKTTSTSFVGYKVSELERQRVLDVRYLGNNRFLSVTETKAAGNFKKLIQKSFK